MHPLAEQLLVSLISQAVSLVPSLIKQFADPTVPNPPPPDTTSDDMTQAVTAIAAAVAHGIAAAAYHASLDRPRLGRAQDLPQLTGASTTP